MQALRKMHHAGSLACPRYWLTFYCHVRASILTGEGRSKKRKRGTKGPATPSGGLSVPVICTANDAYAPCLKPLRDIAAVYHFKPPAPDKLSARLAAIAAAEGLSLDKQVHRHGADSLRKCARLAGACALQPLHVLPLAVSHSTGKTPF
jgi:hypothetical protein